MLTDLLKIIALCLLSIVMACDNSKSNDSLVSAAQEPDLADFRRVELDSVHLLDRTTLESQDIVVESISEQIPEVEKKKSAPKPKPRKKKAVIVFDSLIYHLPEMYEGDKTSLDLKFTNKGEAPLSIKEVDVVCGCTTPEVPFLDILPGEEGKIGIQYNSVGKEGLQEPEITVISNGTPRKIVLKIVVNVLAKKKFSNDSLGGAQKDTLSN